MDLSVYISELLNEHGTINIPQIGVFKQVRMRGHYNADEGKLYPPYFQTEFEHTVVEDDSLLQYITNKSKVSTTSAKYFLDRYLYNILQQAEIGEAMLGRIGWISKDGDVLHFRPAPAVTANTAAFGFAPVSINAEPEPAEQVQETQPVAVAPPVETVTQPVFSVEKRAETVKSDEVNTIASPSPLLRQQGNINTQPSAPKVPAQPANVPVAIETVSEPTHPFYAKPWFFALVAAVIVVALIFIFYPNPEGKSTKEAVAQAPAPSMDSVKIKKTATQTIVQQDTAKKLPAETVIAAPNKPLPASTEFAPEVETPPLPAKPVLVNTKNYHFALMSGAFTTELAAQKVVWRYKQIKVEAAIIKNISRSKYYKVTLGFFKTFAEGKAAKMKLINEKHLRERDLYVETLKRTKK